MLPAPSESFGEPKFLEVDLSHVQPENGTTVIQALTTTPALTHFLADTIESPWDITMAINQHLQGTLECLQQTSSAASSPVSQCSMPRKEPPSAALGGLILNRRSRRSPWAKGDRLTIPASAAAFTQTPTGDHTRWHPQLHPHLSPTTPFDSTTDTGDGGHFLYPPAPNPS